MYSREISGGNASGESRRTKWLLTRDEEKGRDREKEKFVGRRGWYGGGFRRWVPGRRYLQGGGRRHLKCRLEYGGTGANADVNVRASGGKCFIGASFRFCLPRLGRVYVRDAAQRDATAQIKSQPPSFNRSLIY